MGWYYLDEVPAKLLQEVDGVTLIFAVTSKQAQHFLALEIDHQDEKRFFFAPSLPGEDAAYPKEVPP
ncbi:hypothetical protein [Bradyrhizobium sp. URHC0002]